MTVFNRIDSLLFSVLLAVRFQDSHATRVNLDDSTDISKCGKKYPVSVDTIWEISSDGPIQLDSCGLTFESWASDRKLVVDVIEPLEKTPGSQFSIRLQTRASDDSDWINLHLPAPIVRIGTLERQIYVSVDGELGEYVRFRFKIRPYYETNDQYPTWVYGLICLGGIFVSSACAALCRRRAGRGSANSRNRAPPAISGTVNNQDTINHQTPFVSTANAAASLPNYAAVQQASVHPPTGPGLETVPLDPPPPYTP